LQEKARRVGNINGAREGESSVDGNAISDMGLAPLEALFSSTPHTSHSNLESSLNTNLPIEGSATVVVRTQSNTKSVGVERGNLKLCDSVQHL
jgi:hypothetical protein